jgi:RNA polymerase sigma-70 factor, ECF subfamily
VTASDLAAAFAAAGETTLGDERAVVTAALADALATARAVWPQLVVDPVAWVRSLAAFAPSPLVPERLLAGLEIADLYLAFAAASGDAAALAACDALLVTEAGYAAAAARVDAGLRDEAIQSVRTIVFAPRPEKPAAIHDYAGRGRLHGWLRVLVARELVRLAKARSRSIELEDYMLDDAATVDPDPVIEKLKGRYREQLANAFREAMKGLSARDRTLLRYQVIDGLTIDDIGAIYRVHRATAARWLSMIRDELVERTERLLAESLGVDTGEAASIVRFVQSQLEVSVIRHLGPARKPAGPSR